MHVRQLNEHKSKRFVFPFTALLGQEKMKKALILNAVNPRLGGVLIRGEKGTAKSTAVRALAAVLPEIPVVAGCPYRCDPFGGLNRLCSRCLERYLRGEPLPAVWQKVEVVELPVSATEDRLVGSIDFEYAVKHGGRRFEPGLLARANRGILYVDEVNLLDDHLVDALLDAAASGVNCVEREGIAFTHPAEFILVGTMNPEEGELRPQLLDRFGLCVQIEGEKDPEVRVEIIKRREEFDRDPIGFLARWADEEEKVRQAIARARSLLPEVKMKPEMEELVIQICTEACVAGHRADLVLTAAAKTLAAWHGRREVTAEDVYEAAEFVLPHRLRQAPPQHEEPEQPQPEQQEEPENREKEEEQEKEEHPQSPPEEQQEQQEEERDSPPQDAPPASAPETIFAVGEPFPVRKISLKVKGWLRRGSGRRSRGQTATKVGRYIRSTMRWERHDLAFDATLRAAAPYQRRRRREGVAVVIDAADFREKIREKRIGNFLLFVVDASGSMGAQQRMVEAKGAVLSLLLDAYQKRDRVGMVAFRGDRAEVLLPPTNSVERAQKLLAELPTGGRTPLSAGLLKAYEVAKAHLYKDPDIRPLLILISDGRANVSLGGDRPFAEALRAAELIRDERRIKSLVVDVEKSGLLFFGLARKLAEALEADYYKLQDIKAERLVEAVHSTLAGLQ
ncbi:MAG: putative cobaltochelatase [Thermacetogeniaceae bacterium]